MMNRKLVLLACLAGILLQFPAQAQKGSIFVKGLARIQQNGKSWYINTKGQKVFDKIEQPFNPADFEDDEHPEIKENERLLLVKNNGKFGVLDSTNTWLVPAIYDSVSLEYRLYLRLKKADKVTLATTRGKLLVPLLYQDITILGGNYFGVRSNNKWGIYNGNTGTLVIPAMYDQLDYCAGCGSEGDYLLAAKGNKWGVINLKNETIIPFEYQHDNYSPRGTNWICGLQKNGSYVMINPVTKKVYAAPEYTYMETIDDMLKVKKDGYFGLINNEGKPITDFIYDDISNPYSEFENGPFITVTKNKKSGLINRAGKVIVPPSYDGEIRCFEHYYIAKVSGDYKLFDSTGQPVLEKAYTNIEGNRPGYKSQEPLIFVLQKAAVYGFYFPLTKKLIEPAFHEFTSDGSGKYMEVEYQHKKGLYSTSGEEILAASYNNFEKLNDELYLVLQNKNWGLVNIKTKQQVMPYQYTDIKLLAASDTLLEIAQRNSAGDNTYGIADLKGNILLPATYDGVYHMKGTVYGVSKLIGDHSTYTLYDVATRKLQPVEGYKNFSTVEGQMIVGNGEKSGVVDEHNKTIIPTDYADIRVRSRGIYQVVKNTGNKMLYGYIDSTGKELVPCIYDVDLYGYSNFETGNSLLLLKLSPDGATFRQGLASLQGLILIPPGYDQLLINADDKGFIGKNGHKFTLLHANGKPVTSKQFDDIALDEPASYGSVKYSFPVLCREGNTMVYVNEDGTTLPMKVTAIMPFMGDDYNLY
ncbi:WG repeat-containing protein [Chitinophaga sp. Cy-1792]|uniref:WG repeat-containing protein n=1 Tax=Chitinophaga sp. Cy-1792 TaxID=2608339 RepID=UPI001420A1D4|nr:WG repeat-containing protein [Chitinophaga sp. Cy-1792]